jgi:hypothetical protein
MPSKTINIFFLWGCSLLLSVPIATNESPCRPVFTAPKPPRYWLMFQAISMPNGLAVRWTVLHALKPRTAKEYAIPAGEYLKNLQF